MTNRPEDYASQRALTPLTPRAMTLLIFKLQGLCQICNICTYFICILLFLFNTRTFLLLVALCMAHTQSTAQFCPHTWVNKRLTVVFIAFNAMWGILTNLFPLCKPNALDLGRKVKYFYLLSEDETNNILWCTENLVMTTTLARQVFHFSSDRRWFWWP